MLTDPAIEGDPLKFLALCEAYWAALRTQSPRRGPAVLKTHARRLGASPAFDVAVCGGTLGLLLATALQARGLSVCIIERRVVQGRAQEWNAADEEVGVLVEMGLLSRGEVEAALVTACGPMRVAFAGSDPLYLGGALDRGVCPATLLAALRSRFEAGGGVILEGTAFRTADIYTDGLAIRVQRGAGGEGADLADAGRPLAVEAAATAMAVAAPPAHAEGEDDGKGGEEGAAAPPSTTTSRPDAAAREAARAAARAARSTRPTSPDEVTARLLVDCMGHWSPIVKAARPPSKPDGICLVVGTCASGFPPSANAGGGDFLRSVDDASPADDVSWLWEAFPAEGGAARTTYMFAYMDADRRRPSLTHAIERYFAQLCAVEAPGTRLSELTIRRAMFAVLPSYTKGAPLRPPADRVLQAGDAAGGASPLSFGGFGAMLRHLPRLTAGIDDALASGDLSQAALARLAPYQPSLSANALFARAMRCGVGSVLPPPGSGEKARPGASLPGNHINRLLGAHFKVLAALGPGAVGTVVRERTQPALLGASMVGMGIVAPLTIARTLPTLGPGPLAAWFGHYAALVLYSLLRYLTWPLRSLAGGAIAGLAPLSPATPTISTATATAAREARGARLAAAGPPGWTRRTVVALRRGLEALDVGSGHDGSAGGVVMLPEPAERAGGRMKEK
jgi:lycopene cyclase CruP